MKPAASDDPSLEGLSPLEKDLAESMASEGGRSAQMVEARPRGRRSPLTPWTLLSIAALAYFAYRRLSRV